MQAIARRAYSSTPKLRCVVPVIDFEPFLKGKAADKAAVAKQIGDACENIGFLVIKGHGVPQGTIDYAWEETRAFFDLPAKVKETYMSRNEASYPYGYVGFGKEDLAAGKEMEKLSAKLLEAFALSLGLPQNWFDDKITRHRCAMRALNYPELECPPLPGQLRASAHTDYGTLTILKPDDAPGGLQVLPKGEDWTDVPYIPDAFVINLGDLMARWTNDKWVSTLHRVVTPPLNAGRPCRRQSIAFFHNINADYTVSCIDTCTSASNPPKYNPINAFEFLMQKHLASLGYK